MAGGGEAMCPRCVSELMAERMEPRSPISTCVPHSGLSKEKNKQEGQRGGQFQQHSTHPSFVFEGRKDDLTQWGALNGFSKLQLSPTARPTTLLCLQNPEMSPNSHLLLISAPRC
ncbi:hypothetical protein KIL84_001615 [Mauremys mutica]|uniref:Uncharacterized protein n=1 Tax=Mauremys mutica TaxID=74926 RepID=A0A9D3XJG5_9SAUR|nr:hypothetical protein KIL84_001615 [Mauremys mutica]